MMKCIICGGEADKVSLFVPGDKTQLIIGVAPEGQTRSVFFGICSTHLDADGDFLEGIADQVKQNILRRVREPGVVHLKENLDIGDGWEEQKP